VKIKTLLKLTIVGNIFLGNGLSYSSSPVHTNYKESNDCDDDTSSNSDTGSTGTYIIERNDVAIDKSKQSPDFDDNIDDFKKSNSMVKVSH